jgi:hypothetical protein
MPDEKIIKDFPACPHCGSTETISGLATQEQKLKGKIPLNAFTSGRKEVYPIEQPALAVMTLECVMNFYDVCAGCGMERCTRSMLIKAPVQLPPQNNNPLSKILRK